MVFMFISDKVYVQCILEADICSIKILSIPIFLNRSTGVAKEWQQIFRHVIS